MVTRTRTPRVNPNVMAALAARSQMGGPPVAGVPGGAPDAGMPGGAPGMKRGGKTKKMADGGSTSGKSTSGKSTSGDSNSSTPAYGPDDAYERQRRNKLAEQALEARQMGRQQGIQRQQTASERGGVLGTPLAYIERAGQYIGDKFDDADAAVSNALGMNERATFKSGLRQGLKDEGYAKGGSVSSASSRGDGIAARGKTRGKFC